MAEPVSTRLTPRAGRRFAFQVGGAFLALATLAYWRGADGAAGVCAGVGALLGTAGIVVPGRLGVVYRVWMGLGHGIGRVTTPIVLGAVYFLVITPIGVVARVLGHNPLRHRARDDSYWVPAQSQGRSDLHNQF